MKYIIIIIVIFTACSAFAQQPLSSGRFASPSAMYNKNQYYVYAPKDNRGASYWDAKSWHCLVSKDGETWTDKGAVFGIDNISWAKSWAWRSDVKVVNGKYIMAFTAANKIGLATSKYPTGPFEDAVGEALITKETAHTKPLSPAIFVGDGKSVYILYGHLYPKIARISRNFQQVSGTPKSIKLSNYFGGLHMFKKDDLYYVSYVLMDKNYQCSGKIAYATSSSMYGPFQYQGVIIDTKSQTVGHSIADMNGQWKIFYHKDGASRYERHLYSNTIEFSNDGKIILQDN